MSRISSCKLFRAGKGSGCVSEAMDDEWGLSMEELDSLENNAKKQLAERQRSSSSASVPPPGNLYPGQYHYRPPAFSSPMKEFPHSPSTSSGPVPKVSVKFFVDHPGRIGIQAAYNKVNCAELIIPSLVSKFNLKS